MKKVLGLDIGTTSIGWAIIDIAEERKINPITGKESNTDINNERIAIHQDGANDYAVGVRIISAQEMQQRFDEGKKLNEGEKRTPTAERRKYRGSRRTKGRYKLRRDKLTRVLEMLNMLPEGAIFRVQNPEWQPKTEERKWLDVRTNSAYYTNAEGKRGEGNDIGEALYALRDKAVREPIKPDEWGRLMLHFNQWRGYSSDRFAAEEKPKFDYYTAEIIRFDSKDFTPIYDAKEKDRLKYNKYPITVRTTEPINVGSDESEEVLQEFKGYIFLPKADFRQGEFITIKKPERSEEKKGKAILETFFSIKPTKPNPEDWNYRYQNLQKTLEKWNETGGTVGSYFYQNFYLEKNPDLLRIRTNIVNRDWYEREFDLIFDRQFDANKAAFEAIGIEAIVRAAFKTQGMLSEVQQKDGLKEQLRFLIKDKIIYYQRPWQQNKNKARCRFEKVLLVRDKRDKATNETQKISSHEGRTVVPRSHPLHQEFKIWQQINNVKLWHHSPEGKHELMADEARCKELLSRTPEEIKETLYEALQQAKSKSWRTFVNDTLGLDVKVQSDDEKKRKRQVEEVQAYSVNYIKRSKKGGEQDNPLKGNTTKHVLRQILNKKDAWFAMPHTELDARRRAHTGDSNKAPTSSEPISNLQILWESIFDITVSDSRQVRDNIQKHFPELTPAQCEQLSHVKFDDGGMANLSAKAIRQLLPLMKAGKYWDAAAITKKGIEKIASLLAMNEEESDEEEKLESLKDIIPDKSTREHLAGFKAMEDFKCLSYWEAAAVVYGSHSKSKVAKTAMLQPVAQHSMNNPVVEKIVNETLALVNELKQRYGFGEIRIELSRELKASRDEREQMWEGMAAGAQKTEWAKRMLRELKGESAHTASDLETSSKNNLDKIRIIEDVVRFKSGKKAEEITKEYNLKEPSGNDVRRYLMWLEQNFCCPYTDQAIPLTDVFARGKVVEIEHIIPRERYYDNSYANKVITWKEVNTLKGNRTAYEFIVSKRGEDTVILASGKTVRLVSAGGWEDHVGSMFPKGRKRANLIRREIPEDPISRQLKETQYINKKLKEELAKILPGNKEVSVTTGSITDMLRDSWHLNDVMKELMRKRFEGFKVSTGKKTFKVPTLEKQVDLLEKVQEVLAAGKDAFKGLSIGVGKKLINITDRGEVEQMAGNLETLIEENKSGSTKAKPYTYSTSDEAFEVKTINYLKEIVDRKTGEVKDVEVFPGYSKRLDYRHHALDAIIIACTKQWHIQYINTLNAANTTDQNSDDAKKAKYRALKRAICRGESSTKFQTPWTEGKFIPAVREALGNLIVSHKNTRSLISPSKHRNSKGIEQGKPASIRGTLNMDTNYAKRNYFDGDKLTISKVVERILQAKLINQVSTKLYPRSLEQLVRQTVFKEKYQEILIPLFAPYETTALNKALVSSIQKSIVTRINDEKLLIDRAGKPFTELSVFKQKNASVRPMGGRINLNQGKEVTVIADPRIRRIAGYRLDYINGKKRELDGLDLDKAEKDESRRNLEAVPLYSNAIYEVSVKEDRGKPKWIELRQLRPEHLRQLHYPEWKKPLAEEKRQNSKAEKIRMALQKRIDEHDGDFHAAFSDYHAMPLFTSATPIPIKSTRQLAYANDLYEITPGRFVESRDTFMTYVFEPVNTTIAAKREVKFLKFLDAIKINHLQKPDKISYKDLIAHESREDYKLAFTLAKNDLVFLPARQISDEEIAALDWAKPKDLSPFLFVVKDMNPSQDKIVFQHHTYADSISLTEAETRSILVNDSLTAQLETIKYGTVDMLQRCIKVFSDKLGKKFIPYWDFPNGSWDEKIAAKKGLISLSNAVNG